MTHNAHNARARRRNERGAAAVEFAIVLPILIVLVFGIVEFSIAYNREQGLHAAAREGARVAALPQTDQPTIVARVRSALQGVLSPSDIQAATISVTPTGNQPCDGAPAGTHVVVTVSAPDQLAIPLVTNSTVTLTGRGEFLCE
jgi:Flp pilus assembly protein TadG